MRLRIAVGLENTSAAWPSSTSSVHCMSGDTSVACSCAIHQVRLAANEFELAL